MILVNRNFGNHALAQAIGDMFKSSSDDNMNIEWVNHTNALASGSSLVAGLKNTFFRGPYSSSGPMKTRYLDTQSKPLNFFIVTEQFLKVLDKVYTKIWNESFTETGIYNVLNLATIYNGFVNDTSLGENSTFLTSNGQVTNFMLFKKFVDRCITAGVLDEADRLDYKDQISLSDLNKLDLSTNIDLDNKLITLTAPNPINVNPDIDALTGEYLAGKKLYLMVTPYLTNESIDKGSSYDLVILANNELPSPIQEPFINYFAALNTNNDSVDYAVPVRRPLVFFKPKTDASKFGRSLPMATHLIWSLGTPADKELALIEGTPAPDLIFDHLDRISHIDSLVLKIKFDKLQF